MNETYLPLAYLNAWEYCPRRFYLESVVILWTQYSVFECFLTGVQFVKLTQKVEALIKPVEDSVRIYVLDAGAVKRTIAYGSEKPRQEEIIVL